MNIESLLSADASLLLKVGNRVHAHKLGPKFCVRLADVDRMLGVVVGPRRPNDDDWELPPELRFAAVPVVQCPGPGHGSSQIRLQCVRATLDARWQQLGQDTVSKTLREAGHLPRAAFAHLLFDGRVRSRISAGSTANQARSRLNLSRREGVLSMTRKEADDWSTYLRVATGAGVGVTLEGRVVELGEALRTFRRLCRRLERWLTFTPRDATPRRLISALVARLETVPPPESGKEREQAEDAVEGVDALPKSSLNRVRTR